LLRTINVILLAVKVKLQEIANAGNENDELDIYSGVERQITVSESEKKLCGQENVLCFFCLHVIDQAENQQHFSLVSDPINNRKP
jgi:hypothetical protein